MRQGDIEDAIRAFYDTLIPDASDEPAAVLKSEPDLFMEELARGAAGAVAASDARIEKHSEHWRLDRMPAVDRNILRLAIYEMKTVNTAPAIVIDEALELARRFSGDQSVPFINGVLDAVGREP